MALLTVDNLSVSYGGLRAVVDASLRVEAGECFVLLGANGAGKTSILRAISRLIAIDGGSIVAGSQDLRPLRPFQVTRAGISHVPEGRRVFPHLTVRENLVVSHIARASDDRLGDALERVYELFPRLSERHGQYAGTLSGGEQQALAIGRALMNAPSLLMLDEPSLGLSPLLTQQVFQQLAVIREQGIALLLVEQNASCLQIATRGVVLANGRVVMEGTNSELRDSEFVRKAYLGL